MQDHSKHEKQISEYGESWGIAMVLLDKPLDREGIREQFRAFTRRFGFFGVFSSATMHGGIDFNDWLQERLEVLIAGGWIEKKENLYDLTDKGRAQAAKALEEIRKARSRVQKLATPENASKLSLIVHLLLAALKLPAGILSGSVALLNDAIDTLLDGVSSLMVYWGLRAGRERLVSRLLVLFMMATGAFALFQAIMRLVRREAVGADWFAFAATLISAAVCAVLWFIQRFIGLRRNSMALITQSVDSRNHVIVAASVTAGLIAALLRFPWLDYLIGLVVALLILKSAVELAVELIRSKDEDTLDLARYRFGIYERFRRRQLCSYMLYLVRNGEVENKNELIHTVERGFDFQDNVLLKSMGAEHIEGGGELIESCYQRLVQKDHLREGGRLEITEAGDKHLSSNRFFLSPGERASGFRLNLGRTARITFSLIVRWTTFLGLYWLGTAYLLPRLPDLSLWKAFDYWLLSVGALHLSLFQVLHVAAGFCLVSYAAVRKSLIYQRHLVFRERRGRKPSKLRTDGFFARVRHPMTGTTLLYNLGLFFAFCSGWAFVPFLLIGTGEIIASLREEKNDLLERFGREYRDYRKQVPSLYLTPFMKICFYLAAVAFIAGLIL